MKYIKRFEKIDNKNNSKNNIITLAKNDDGEYDEIKEPVKIVQVTGILTDEKEIEKIENQLEESIAGGPVFNTDLQLKQVKRGDTIWVTALLQKTKGTVWGTQSTMGVLKCRIQDIYYGLNKLKSIKGRN